MVTDYYLVCYTVLVSSVVARCSG